MIIYGFYGVGKSTFCKNHPECIDADRHYFDFSENRDRYDSYENYVRSLNSDDNIVLVNGYVRDVDFAVFPEDYERAVNTLKRRKQGNFIPPRDEYDGMIQKFLDDRCRVYFLNKDEYLSDAYQYLKEGKVMGTPISKIKKLEAEKKKIDDNLNAQIAIADIKKKEIDEKIARIQAEMSKKYEDICLDALIVGTYGMHMENCSIAPYTNGYRVSPNYSKYRPDADKRNPVPHTYCAAVDTQRWQELPKALADFLMKQGWGDNEFATLKKDADTLWAQLPKGYDAGEYVPDKHKYLHGNYIANGYETTGFDNITRGYCGGTWSSNTTAAQNDLARILIALKGFCPENVIASFPNEEGLVEIMSEVFARHGIDSDLSDMKAWGARNPSRCDSQNPHFIPLSKMSEIDNEDLSL